MVCNGGELQGRFQVVIIAEEAVSYLWCAAMLIHSNKIHSLSSEVLCLVY